MNSNLVVCHYICCVYNLWKSLKLFNFQNGETPLHKACRKCHYPAVKELLAHAKKQNKDNEKKIEQYVRQANHDGEQVRI